MSTFNSILSSIGGQQKTSLSSSSNNQAGPPSMPRPPANGTSLTPRNVAAGVKRRSEEPEGGPNAKTVKTGQHGAVPKSTQGAPTNRFQLSAKTGAASRPIAGPHRSSSTTVTTSSPQRPIAKPVSLKPSGKTTIPPLARTQGAAPPKRGFASILEKAKAAQAVAKTATASNIRHQTASKMTKRERRKMQEEAEAQQKSNAKGKQPHVPRSQGRLAGTSRKDEGTTTGYKGTMKKAPEPLAYKGTMRAAGAEDKQKKVKGEAQDKYGGYASWSDLDDAEDEEEDYDSDASSDMEGGFDAVEQEEMSALRSARREDQEALEEEERHRREKEARKRKLEQLSRTAAAKRKY